MVIRSSGPFSISFFIKKYCSSDSEASTYVRITVDSKRMNLPIKRKADFDRWDERKELDVGDRPDFNY